MHVGAGVRRETGHSGLAFQAAMGLPSGGGLGVPPEVTSREGLPWQGRASGKEESLNLERVSQAEERSSYDQSS